LFVKSFNDFDQALPFIDYVASNTDDKLLVWSFNPDLSGCKDHISYLNNSLDISLEYLDTINTSSPKIWLTNNLEKKSNLYRDDKITSLERAQEILLTNLRLTKDLKIKALLKIANADKVESFLNLNNCEMLKDQGFIEMNSSIIKNYLKMT
jgi:coproporphyrinogen III oxidase-like Fe-S oxidoreductase